MDELITWLRAQLDDEAEAAEDLDEVDFNGVESTAGPDARRRLEEWRAEVEAKRRILDEADAVRDEVRNPTSGEHYANARARQFAYEQVTRALAQPYAGREGWREEWRNTPDPR